MGDCYLENLAVANMESIEIQRLINDGLTPYEVVDVFAKAVEDAYKEIAYADSAKVWVNY